MATKFINHYDNDHATHARKLTRVQRQEAQILQRECATHYVSKFVLHFKQQHWPPTSFIHSRALAMLPLDRLHTISY